MMRVPPDHWQFARRSCCRALSVLLSLIMVLAVPVPLGAQGQRRIALVRDAEIEATLRAYATPVWQAAGIVPDAVRLYLVDDPAINAFVAGGQNLFIYTGLLRRTTGPGEVIGVIAHETGHMAGGHLVRMQSDMRNLSTAAILAYVLGAAAAAAGGGGAGAAVLTGTTQLAQRTALRYSRTQEQAADQAGVSFLERAGWSPAGMLAMMQTIDRERQVLGDDSADPYVQTHPLPQQRIAFLERQVAASPDRDVPWPPALITRHRRMLAKLQGFLDAPAETLRKTATATDFASRYARLIALYRLPDLPAAEALFHDLDRETPDDPYLWELRGQMRLENQQVTAAIGDYARADTLSGGQNPVIRMGYARALLAGGTAEQLQAALPVLRSIALAEPRNTEVWRMLSILYGQQGQEARAALALAEKAYVEGDGPQLTLNLRRAGAGIATGHSDWLRLQDLKKALAEDERFQ
jgi:predicted Zn-dependent protease